MSIEKVKTLICIKKGKIKNLTIGKRYKIVRTNSGIHYGSNIPYSSMWIINDAGIEKHYSSKRFRDVAEWRDKQLNELGI